MKSFYTTSKNTTYDNIFAQNDCRCEYEVRIACNGELIVFGEDRITEIQTNKYLFDGTLTIGGVCGAEIDLSFLPQDANGNAVTPDKMAKVEVFERVSSETLNSTSDWLQIGVYYIDTREVDATTGIMSIHGYDEMQKANVVLYANNYSGSFSTTTYRAMATTIASNMGLSLDNSSAISSSMTFSSCPKGYSMRELLSAIALSGCFCIESVQTSDSINGWTRKLRLVKLNDSV